MLGYVSVNQWQQPGVAPSAEAVAAAYERALDVKLARAQLLFAAQGLGVGLGTHGVLGAAAAAVGEVLHPLGALART